MAPRYGDLTEDDPSDGALTKWPYADDRRFPHVAGWVKIELMKNVAEMSHPQVLAS